MKIIDLTGFIPPDKSDLIRQFLFSLITVEKVEISYRENLPLDIVSALNILPFFGKTVSKKKTKFIITGPAVKPKAAINCENSATLLHLLMGICILKGWKTILTGDRSLMNRDHSLFFDAAGLYGTDIVSTPDSFTVIPSPEIPEVKTKLSKQSAQLKGFHIICMLKSGGELQYSAKMRQNTENILVKMGADIKEEKKRIYVYPAKNLGGYFLPVHKDPSAAFIAACAALVSGFNFKISNVYPEHTRTEPFKFLINCGIKVAIDKKNGGFNIKSKETSVISNEPFNIPEKAVPSVIDEIPFMAYMSVRSGNPFFLSNGDWLKNKESDRVAETVKRIGKIYETFEKEAGFAVIPEEKKKLAAEMPHSDDHRMEMLSAIIALDRNISFDISESVNISFPLFPEMIQHLKKICRENSERAILNYRKKIDKIDDRIAKLLSERMRIASEVIEIKKETGIDIFDSKRENEIISRLSRHHHSISNLVNDLYRRIFDWIKKG